MASSGYKGTCFRDSNKIDGNCSPHRSNGKTKIYLKDEIILLIWLW